MANPEGGGVNRTIDDGNAVVNSGSAANLHDPDPASDTEQHGGVDISGQKLGAGKKKACFQITQVLPVSKAANNDGNMDDPDSNDEQDESHADDFSSSERIDSFNMSKCSIPDLDHSLDDGSSFDPVVAPSSIPAPSGSAEEQTNNVTSNATQANGNGPHRFKVVRVASEPIRKGRWICRDFPSESSNVKTTNQTTPDSLRNQDPSKETLHSGNSSAASSVHYVHGQDNNSDNPLTVVDESGKPSDLGRKTSSTSTKDSENRINPKAIQEDQKDDKLRLVEQLKDELDLQEHSSESTEGDEGTSPAGGAIDNKIEQAMDLVKSHLLFAVREEVEVLKEQIKILEAKNELLQEENSALKKRLTQTSTAPANMAMAPPPQSSHQHQGMPMQQPNQEPQPYPSMPNQMGQASLGQAQMGQAMSDHAAYPQHPRTTQQTHSAPNPGGLPEPAAQYTPQTSVESQGQYHVHSQRHIQTGQAPQQGLQQGIQDMTQYSQVAGGVATAAPQSQGQYHPNH